MTATIPVVIALFAWSTAFVSQFAIPKVIVLVLGLIPMAYYGRIEWGKSLIGSGAWLCR